MRRKKRELQFCKKDHGEGMGTHLCAKSIVINKMHKVTRMNIVITLGTSTIAGIIVTSAEAAEETDLYLRVDGGESGRRWKSPASTLAKGRSS
jgi:hypothetical protein